MICSNLYSEQVCKLTLNPGLLIPNPIIFNDITPLDTVEVFSLGETGSETK